MTIRLTLPACLVFALSAPAPAADLDRTRAVVVTPPNLTGPAAKAVGMLAEEADTRAMVRWERAEKWPAAGTPVVVVGPADEVRKLLDKQDIKLPAAAQPKAEGYQIGVSGQVVWVHNPTGDDKFKDADWLTFGTLQGPKTVDLAKLSAGLLKNHHPKRPLFAQETLWSGNGPHMRSVGRDFLDDELRKNAFVLMFSATALNFADNSGDSSTGFSGTLDLNDRRQARHDVIRGVWDQFEALPYRRTAPRPELLDRGFCLADEGRDYLVYLPDGGPFAVAWVNARDAKDRRAGETADGKNLKPPGDGDWVLHLHADKDGIEDVSYPSKLLKQDVPIKVYLPPGYAAGKDRYPVVYNLHGGG